MPRESPGGANQRNGDVVHPKTVSEAQARTEDRPHWDRRTRTLFFGDRVVKRLRRTAPIAELILQAFEDQGWPFRIDDPLPAWRGHNAKQRLHDSIQNLNRRLGSRLLIFRGDGFGKGVCWETE
jgi:hypothetical protein